MKEIKILVNDLKAADKNLEDNIKSFLPYTQDFQSSKVKDLSAFNSDFIEEIKDTLENMADSKAPELLKKITIFRANLKSIIENFEKADEESVKGIEKVE